MDSMRLWEKHCESLDKDVYRFEKGDVMAIISRVVQRITKSGKKIIIIFLFQNSGLSKHFFSLRTAEFVNDVQIKRKD